MPVLKSPREIGLMREAGRVVFQALSAVEERARPGVTTAELNAVAEELIGRAGAVPLFKGVVNPQAKFPFPAALCTSVNEQVVHGIPGQRRLASGDIVSIDCGVRLRGYCADSATTVAIGRVSAEVARLLSVTRAALELAIREARAGRLWSEVAGQIQALVERAGYSVVREFVGHGIGQSMHEEPKVPNYVDRRTRRGETPMRVGLTLAVEPMVNMGGREVELADHSGWTVVTKDRKWSAHFEHTIAVTEGGCEVLTDGS